MMVYDSSPAPPLILNKAFDAKLSTTCSLRNSIISSEYGEKTALHKPA